MKKNKNTYIVGISAFENDSSASILKNSEIIAAAQEERFSRKKNDACFPVNALKYCLKEAAIGLEDVDAFVYYKRPLYDLKKVFSAINNGSKKKTSLLKVLYDHIKNSISTKRKLQNYLGRNKNIVFENNIYSYAASAFFPSPFSNAAILIVDSCGEYKTTGFGLGRNNKIKLFKKLNFPHSIKQAYSAFTYYCGFNINAGEYKLMGLAPYGKPIFESTILENIIHIQKNGVYTLNLDYFDIVADQIMPNKKFDKIFNTTPRKFGSEITQKQMDLAASIQSATEKVIMNMVKYVKKKTKCKNICLAGNVALNCVINGKIAESGLFENIWIQPSPTDSGAALGAAFLYWHKHKKAPRILNNNGDLFKGSMLGPSYTDDEIELFLKKEHIIFTKIPIEDIPKITADLIASQKVVGWFQGRMEFGPRALGSRSILADARSRDMHSIINQKIKFRESFRPLAPSILEEMTGDYFYLNSKSPYMLMVAPVIKEKRSDIDIDLYEGLTKLDQILSSIPAVTHVNFSSRVQTVNSNINKLYYNTINKFYEKFGCPLIINTSFNIQNEPIVCSPKDAFICFMNSGIDHLIMGSFLINKNEQV